MVAKYNDIYIDSCYLSPNIHRADVQDALDELRDVINNLGQRILIGGDFNGKSILWGGTYTCPSGQLLEDWAAEFDLCLLNEGSVPTCVRPQGYSIIDVTWCTPDLRGEISGWKVREDLESLSDHHYVTMDISCDNGSLLRSIGPSLPRWQRGEWNMDAFQAVARWEFGQSGLDQDASVNPMAQKATKIIQDSCDAAADKVRPNGGRKRIYWWNSSIAQARKVSTRARRAWTKAKTRHWDSETTQELRDV